MIAFFRRLRSAWNYLNFVPYVPEADHEDAWTAEDARAYTGFMKSATGQKLATRMTNLRIQSAVNAASANSNTKFKNGWATSVAATLSWLDDHLVDSEPAAETQEETADFEERFRP